MHHNSYRSFLRNFCLMSALYECVFAYAVYTVLFHMRGLSVFQISLLLGIWGVLGITFEIPSGALADSWNRKTMLTIAPLLKSGCFLIWAFADGNFWIYVLGLVSWELGGASASGTTEAVLYDALVHFGKTGDYEKILGRIRLYERLSVGLAGILGVLMEPRIQRNIGSISRATVTSMVAFMSGLAGIGFPVALGYISRIWDLRAMYMASAVFLFAVAWWAFLVREKLAGPGR